MKSAIESRTAKAEIEIHRMFPSSPIDVGAMLELAETVVVD